MERDDGNYVGIIENGFECQSFTWIEVIFNRLPTGIKSSIISSHDDSMGWPFFNQTYLVFVRRARWFSSRHVKLTAVPFMRHECFPRLIKVVILFKIENFFLFIYRKNNRVNGHQIQNRRGNDIKKDALASSLSPILGPAFKFPTIK